MISLCIPGLSVARASAAHFTATAVHLVATTVHFISTEVFPVKISRRGKLMHRRLPDRKVLYIIPVLIEVAIGPGRVFVHGADRIFIRFAYLHRLGMINLRTIDRYLSVVISQARLCGREDSMSVTVFQYGRCHLFPGESGYLARVGTRGIISVACAALEIVHQCDPAGIVPHDVLRGKSVMEVVIHDVVLVHHIPVIVMLRSPSSPGVYGNIHAGGYRCPGIIVARFAPYHP